MWKKEDNDAIWGTTQREKNWLTADNEMIPFSKVTHQHWSNIYWYHLVFQDIVGLSIYSMNKQVELARKEINQRFGGEILEWRPIFSYEIKWLNKLGMLKSGTEISYNDKKIGNILTCPVKIIPGFE